MINAYNGRNHALGEYQHAYKNLFKYELKDGKIYTDTISGEKKR